MSSTATSGLSSVTPLTAARPSAASPITSMSDCELTSIRNPSRSIAWSSARKTRSFSVFVCVAPCLFIFRVSFGERVQRVRLDGDADEDGRALARLALDLDRAADECRAFTHPDESQPAIRARHLHPFEVEAAPVVLDDQHRVAVASFEQEVNVRRGGVLRHVVQGLLHDAVEVRLDERREARAAQARGVEVDLDAEVLRPLLRVS